MRIVTLTSLMILLGLPPGQSELNQSTGQSEAREEQDSGSSIDVFDVLTAVAFLIAVAPHVWHGYTYLSRERTMKLFWTGKGSNYIVIYPVHEDPNSGTGEFRLMKHETVSATRKIDEFLKTHGCHVVLKRSSDVLSDDEKRSNIVLIGSSRTNSAVAAAFGELENRFKFVADAQPCIWDTSDDSKLTSPMDRGFSADLALIERIKNPSNPAARIYYLAGIHSVGCWAAAEYVSNYSNLKRLPRSMDEFAWVIKAEFSGFYNLTKVEEYLTPQRL